MTQRITIFGDIGLTVGGTTSSSIKAQLDQLDRSQPLRVEINSEGGSVMEGLAIFNMLRTWPANVDVEIVGWALSAATVVAMAGRTIRAHPTSLLMIHSPWMNCTGSATELRENADLLDQSTEALLQAYSRTGQPDAVIRGWLDGTDHWFTADEALSLHLIDELIPAGAQAAAPVNLHACRYPIPSPIKTRIQAMSQSASIVSASNHDAVRAEALREDQLRRTAVRAQFDGVCRHTPSLRHQLATLQAQCEDDPRCTPEMAGTRILAAMATGVEPAAGWYVADAERGDRRVPEFIAAASDVLLMRNGVRVRDPHPAARDIQNMSIVGMAERILSMKGVSISQKSKSDIIQAALSTTDFPSLLSGTAGKALREGYESTPATFKGWTGEREVTDFKENTLVALSEAPALLQVAEGAEYKHGTFQESGSVFKLKTFGRVVQITRQALINDDTQAFTAMPKAFAAAARRLEADSVYDILLSNPILKDGVPLFHASHGNLVTAAALNVVSLGEARAAMRKQKGIAGAGYVDPQPRYLIVPVKQETTAEQLLASMVDPSKSNDTSNVEWIRGLTLVSDPRLDAVSETAWYLAAAPAQIEGIVRAYLAGEPRPFLDEKAEFERDVVSYKTRLDIASGVVDYRALVKNPNT